MSDLLPILKEWRDARLAFFQEDFKKPIFGKNPIWDRLANAEHALMDLAKNLEEIP